MLGCAEEQVNVAILDDAYLNSHSDEDW